MDFTKIRDEFNRLQKEIHDSLATETLTNEQKEINDKKFARMDELKAVIESANKLKSFGSLTIEEKTGMQPVKLDNSEQFDEKKLLSDYLKFGRVHETFTIDSSSGSGVLIPSQVAAPFLTRKNTNVFRRAVVEAGYSPITTTAMVTINVPVFDDSSNAGAAQSESATSQTVAEQTVTGITLSPTLYSSKGIWFSRTSVLAPGYDPLNSVLPQLFQRVEAARESALGADLVANATVGKTTASTTAITYSEVLDWFHSLSVGYRSDRVYFLSDSLFRLIRGLVDDQHRPILVDTVERGAFSIDGRPVYITDSLEAVAAGKVVGVVASAEAIKIYDAGSPRVVRYENYPAKPDQVGFEVFANGDMGFATPAVKALKMAAS